MADAANHPSHWAGAIAECDTLEKFNEFSLKLARERRTANPKDGFAIAVAREAVRRGYTYAGDRETGFYVEMTAAEYAAVMEKLDKCDHREQRKRMMKSLAQTKVKLVKASWEQWVYNSTATDGVGALLLVDFRERKGNRFVYEFDAVPQELFQRLFVSDAKQTLDQIYRMFSGQDSPEERNWKEAF